ncbi:hypothetical protein WJX74_004318 [Apatococcus lobatus]|uniref:Protein kinase domain-containing protein n=1 Tax=Apatococcus lobatus TaxID=904363 RepID=A0AAW1RVK3_9CHLO
MLLAGCCGRAFALKSGSFRIRKTALRYNAGAMATPEALDIEAQQLEDKADRLGNEVIELEKQQLAISAKAKLQEAETSRVNASRKRDQADALRLQISGSEHRLPAEKVTSVSIARQWAPASKQLDGALFELLANTDEFRWVEDFGNVWKAEQENLAQVQLNLLPCIHEPSESYADGRKLVQQIVKRMPGYAAKAPAMPTIYIFCNKTALSESENERKSRPDLAYCGFEEELSCAVSAYIILAEVDSKDQYKHVRVIAEYKPFSSYSEGEYEDGVGKIIRRCRCALNVGRDPFVLPALVTDNRYIRAYLVRDSRNRDLQHIWKAKRLPLCVERGAAHPSAPLLLDTSSDGFKELAFLLWLGEALRLRAEAEHQDLWLRPGQQLNRGAWDQVSNELAMWQALGAPVLRGLASADAQGSVASVDDQATHGLIGSPIIVTSPLGIALSSMPRPIAMLQDPSSLVADVSEGLHCLQRHGVSHNDVRPCNMGLSTSRFGGFYCFDLGYARSWDALRAADCLPAHGLYSSLDILQDGRPAPFSDMQALLFSAMDLSGCTLPWAEVAKVWGHSGAVRLRLELMQDPLGSSVLSSWPQHLQLFALRVFEASLLPVKQQQQMVDVVQSWLHELRTAIADSPSSSSSSNADMQYF